MDAIKILGSLLGNNATSSKIGDQVLGGLLGSLLGGGQQQAGAGGGLGSVLGSMLGGGQQQAGAGGGLGSVLGGMLGGGPQQSGGGLGSVLGGMLGGGSQQSGGGLGSVLGGMLGGGGLGSVLGSMLGGGRQSRGGVNWGLLGGLAMAAFHLLGKRGGAAAGGAASLAGLEQMLDPQQEVAPADAARIQQQALVMLKAMINAAKADGQIDAQEQQNIVARLAELGPDEEEFVKQELAKPLNLDFLQDANPDMASNVYLMSLMAISLDTPEEENYMRQLAQRLGLEASAVNELHTQLGLPPLYA